LAARPDGDSFVGMTSRARLAALSFISALATTQMPGAVWAEPLARSSAAQEQVAAHPATPTVRAAPSRCPHAAPIRARAALESDAIDELSGLVASRAQPGVFWVHNDSGDKGRLFAIDLKGRLLLELALTNAKPRDVEDIAIGPRAGARGSYLYLADTGNNRHERKAMRIYRLAEPNVREARTAGQRPRRMVDVIEVRYEDGPHDVETLLIDPSNGDLYLVAKGALFAPQQLVGVYRVPAAELAREEVLARKVASLPLGPATAGDILPDGSGIAIRNYTSLYFWPRAAGQSIASALKQPACPLPLADFGQQGEALGFTADGRGYVTIAEGRHAKIYRFSLTRP
jgi:hypothetical protein